MPKLKERTPYKVLTLDLAGTGRENAIQSPWTIRGIVDQIVAKYGAKLAAENQIVLVGISLGGMVACELAHRYPTLISQVILINSSSRLSPLTQRLYPRQWLRLLRALISPLELREKIILQMTSQSSPKTQDPTLQRFISFQIDQPVARAVFWAQVTAAARFALPKLVQQVSILASKGDQLVAPSCSQRLADFFVAKLHYHPRAGHDLSLDDPDWLVDRLNSLIENNRKNSA